MALIMTFLTRTKDHVLTALKINSTARIRTSEWQEKAAVPLSFGEKTLHFLFKKKKVSNHHSPDPPNAGFPYGEASRGPNYTASRLSW